MPEAQLSRDGMTGWLRLSFRYDPGLIEELKHQIHPDDREWDSQERCWWITPEGWHELRHILQNMGYTVRDATNQLEPWDTNDDVMPPNLMVSLSALHLAADAPLWLAPIVADALLLAGGKVDRWKVSHARAIIEGYRRQNGEV